MNDRLIGEHLHLADKGFFHQQDGPVFDLQTVAMAARGDHFEGIIEQVGRSKIAARNTAEGFMVGLQSFELSLGYYTIFLS